MSWAQEGGGVGKDPQRLEGPVRWRSLLNLIATRSEENIRHGQTNKTREQLREGRRRGLSRQPGRSPGGKGN